LTVSAGKHSESSAAVIISDVSWKGFRCKVAIEGDPSGLSLDLRTHPGNPSTSLVMDVKLFKEDGTSSVVVEDSDLEGQKATLVVVDAEGRLVAQRATAIAKEAD
jgi:hypothetical protein